MISNLLYYLDTAIRFSKIRWPIDMIDSLKYQWFEENRRKEIQIHKTNKLLKIANSRNVYYSKKFAGLKTSVTTMKDLHDLPILEKKEIRSDFEILVTDIGKNYKTGTTSGSTGIPLRFLISTNSVLKQAMSFNRFLSWYNLKSYHKNVLLWGEKYNTEKKMSSQIRRWLFNPQFRLSIFDLNEKTFPGYIEKIASFKPKYFRSYKSAAIQFAEIAEKLEFDLTSIDIKLVVVTSEVLFPADRQFLEKSFGCKVANEYGASEIGQFAFECPKGSLHINDDVNYLWTNSENELYVTSLHNTKFPLINYKIGDKVVLSGRKCACKRTLPIIEQIKGRSDDQIVKPNGELLSQYTFYYLFEEISKIYGIHCIANYRVSQLNNKFTFEIIKGQKFNAKSIEYIRERSFELIDPTIDIIIEFKTSLQRDTSGKLWFFKRITKKEYNDT